MILSKIASLVLYLTLFFFVFTLGFLSFKTKRKYFAVLAIIIPAILVALRFQTGTDTENYKDIYDALNNQSFESAIAQAKNLNFEPFTILAARFSKTLGFEYFFFFLCHSLITFFALFLVSKRVDPERYWILFGALVIIMLPYSLNTMRQAAATAIFSILLLRVYDHPSEWIKNASLLIAMVFCHFSSVLLLPVLVLCFFTRKTHPKKLFGFTGIIISISVLIFPALFTVLSRYSLIPPKYISSLGGFEVNFLNFDFLIFLVISSFFILTRAFKNNYSNSFNNFIFLVIFCNLFYSGIGFYSWYVGRMSDFFWPFATIGMWLLIDKLHSKNSTKILFFSCATLAYFLITGLLLNNGGIFPYGAIL